MASLFEGRGSLWAAVLVALASCIVVPLANLWAVPGSPWYLSNFMVGLLGKFVCYALLALAVGLIWGYAGMLSLGHGAFFTLGGYCMGMYLMRQIGPRGVYGHPVLPDFMVFLSWESLPWYWWGFDWFLFAMAMAVLVPSLLALVFGWFSFRSRISGVYFAIITQAMTFALMLAFFRNETGFGGNNGLTDFRDILGYSLRAPGTRVGLFVASVLALLVGYLVCRSIVASRLGRVLVAIRDHESRVRFLGYAVESYKLFVFILSAAMAGIAGALYVPQVGIINPSEFAPAASIEIVIWVAVGGRGTLWGPIVGAFVVNYAKTWLTTAHPEIWLFFLGALFVGATLAMPRGIAGLVMSLHAVPAQLRAWRARWRPSLETRTWYDRPAE